MTLVPFNRKNILVNAGSNLGDWQSMLDNIFNIPHVSGRQNNNTFKIDIEETETSYFIDAELPGVAKDEIDLSIEDDNLAISVNRQEEVENNDRNYIHKERRNCSMRRCIRLVDAHFDAITAKVEDGILRITVPKNEHVGNNRKIAIE